MAVTEGRDEPLLVVEGLEVAFGSGRRLVRAVRGVDFTVRAGECLAIVGESGSGKSATARALVGLAGSGASVRATSMRLEGLDLTGVADRQWQRVRGGRIGLVPQDALASLDPLRTVGAEVGEALANHGIVDRRGRSAKVVDLLEQVHMPDPRLRARQFPHQLSGGLRQRALVASSIAADPAMIIADEPTTALDVTIAAQVLDLLDERKIHGTAILLISHDLAVVARLADRIAVMHAGVFVEVGGAAELLSRPAHPYTRELLAAVPTGHAKGTRLSTRSPDGPRIAAVAARPADPGCAYAGRCPLVTDDCRAREPVLVGVGLGGAPARSGSPVLSGPPVLSGTPVMNGTPVLSGSPPGGGAAPGAGHSARCWRIGDEWPAPRPRAADSRDGLGAVVVEATGISKSFRGPDRVERSAVDDVSLVLRAGETLGIVGESGSGKSTTAHIVMGLLEPDAGSVRLLGRPWSGLPESARRADRHHIQLVQQDPVGSFDPRHTVERILGEGLGHPGGRAARRQRDRIVELLGLVGLDEGLLHRHPWQLSGGQRQRVAIARALAPRPSVLVCDEPVSALDVSVQAQILDLFADVQRELGLALLFISHDLGVIYHISDRMLVMRAGEVVESGPVEAVFRDPRHPYTKNLLTALPSIETTGGHTVRFAPST